ncbi:TraX family protein [Mycoplasma todarodis]
MNKIENVWMRVFNSMTFKIVALISMVIDHVGVIIFPGNQDLRIIGRIALPIFTFLIAFGFSKTRNPGSYFLKLFFVFICIQIPTTWYLYSQENPEISPFYMNIFCNLSLGAGFIVIYKKNKLLSILYFAMIFWFLYFVQENPLMITNEKTGLERFEIDYGLYGFMLIVGFWMVREAVSSFYKLSGKKIIMNIASASWLVIITLINQYWMHSTEALKDIQMWALIDVVLLLMFTEFRFNIPSKKVRITIQYFFYLTYPLTLGITILFSNL